MGVIGVIECNFLQPTHNKQDFDDTNKYRCAVYHSTGIYPKLCPWVTLMERLYFVQEDHAQPQHKAGGVLERNPLQTKERGPKVHSSNRGCVVSIAVNNLPVTKKITGFKGHF